MSCIIYGSKRRIQLGEFNLGLRKRTMRASRHIADHRDYESRLDITFVCIATHQCEGS